MKLSSKNVGSLVLLCLLCALACGLAWEVVERIAARLSFPLNLSIGPIGFDLGVISFHFMANPGTVIGLAAGILLFRTL